MLKGRRCSTTTGHNVIAFASVERRIRKALNRSKQGSSFFNCPMAKMGSRAVSRCEQSEARWDRPRLFIGLTRLVWSMKRSTHLAAKFWNQDVIVKWKRFYPAYRRPHTATLQNYDTLPMILKLVLQHLYLKRNLDTFENNNVNMYFNPWVV